MAIKIERQQRRKASTRGNTPFKSFSNPLYTPNNARKQAPQPPLRIREPGESSKPKPPITDNGRGKQPMVAPERSRDIQCFKCLGRGHVASQCPNRRVMLMREDGEIESDSEEDVHELPTKEDEENNLEVAESGQVMEIMVVKHSLNVQQVQDEQQRETIFHTRCKIQDKVCVVIIDSGSCTNVASSVMVDRLGLKTTKHPNPYKLQWLNDGGELKVTKQVVVPFSIGNYKDEVLCDVVSMDATHLLLGRPWQYDKRAMHDGFTNRYSFMHAGKKITLAPLTPSQVIEDQTSLKKSKEVAKEKKKMSVYASSREIRKFYSKTLQDHVEHLRAVLQTLREERLYGNVEKCVFCTDRLTFLGYIVSAQGVEVDHEKIKAIQNGHESTSITRNRSFHGLASFYRRFVPNFSSITAPLTGIIKKNSSFLWGKEQEDAFLKIKDCLTKAPVLALPDFDKTFEIECDASGVGKDNVVADALSRRYVLLSYLDSHLIGFAYIRELYSDDHDFCDKYNACEKGADGKFYRHDGYLFKENRICIPQGSMRDILIREAHEGGLMGHFRVTKTLHTLKEHLFWPKMRRTLNAIVNAVTCS
ncbi:uncharacterized protein LOC128037043 [Gossypium raimondii]|uniref:uncharacterized protein LOC128037043 n=1 Tax=Gossypium raimondii TaxID=29730 RepID=UPI00227B8D46|nr:uncharacterized protein LOC128037043 [Gossypium raimondii]